MSFSIASRSRKLFRLGKVPDPGKRAFLPFSLWPQPGSKLNGGGRLLHSGPNPPKTYFASPSLSQSQFQSQPQFQSQSQGIWFQIRGLLLIVVSSAFVYEVYSHIETVPETGRKRLNILSENFYKHVLETGIGHGEFLRVLSAMEREIDKETSTQYEEQIHRVNHILQKMLSNSGYDPRSLNICVIDIPHSLGPSINENAATILMDLKTLSSYSDNNELAFQLGRQIAISKIQPEIDIHNWICLLSTIPFMFLSNTVRKYKIGVGKYKIGAPLHIAIGMTIVQGSSYFKSLREVDFLGMVIMAKAGYDPRAAIETAKKESVWVLRHNMVDENNKGSRHLSSAAMQQRVKVLEKQLPVALAVMPAEPATFQSATTSEASLEATPVLPPHAEAQTAESSRAESVSAESRPNDPPTDDSQS